MSVTRREVGKALAAQLKAGASVTAVASASASHSHVVTVTCVT